MREWQPVFKRWLVRNPVLPAREAACIWRIWSSLLRVRELKDRASFAGTSFARMKISSSTSPKTINQAPFPKLCLLRVWQIPPMTRTVALRLKPEPTMGRLSSGLINLFPNPCVLVLHGAAG